jgi:hypothetical protein
LLPVSSFSAPFSLSAATTYGSSLTDTTDTSTTTDDKRRYRREQRTGKSEGRKPAANVVELLRLDLQRRVGGEGVRDEVERQIIAPEESDVGEGGEDGRCVLFLRGWRTEAVGIDDRGDFTKPSKRNAERRAVQGASSSSSPSLSRSFTNRRMYWRTTPLFASESCSVRSVSTYAVRRNPRFAASSPLLLFSNI